MGCSILALHDSRSIKRQVSTCSCLLTLWDALEASKVLHCVKNDQVSIACALLTLLSIDQRVESTRNSIVDSLNSTCRIIQQTHRIKRYVQNQTVNQSRGLSYAFSSSCPAPPICSFRSTVSVKYSP